MGLNNHFSLNSDNNLGVVIDWCWVVDHGSAEITCFARSGFLMWWYRGPKSSKKDQAQIKSTFQISVCVTLFNKVLVGGPATSY